MKSQRINPNTMNPMQMNSMTSMMGMMNNIQKIGKGKRKINVSIDKGSKKFLAKFIDEVRKQFLSSPAMGAQTNAMTAFFDYLQAFANNKDAKDLKLSFEEYEFLKRILIDSVKGMEATEFKWYQFVKKGMVKVLIKQYKELLTKFK